jgi:hypothetical protein
MAMQKSMVGAAALVVGGLLASSSAQAVLQFSAEVNGVSFGCVDQNVACDTNPAVGVLQTGASAFGGVSFLGSSQTQTTGADNTLNTTSFQIVNNNATAVDIQFAVGGTDFTGPVTGLNQSGSGTFQNAIGSTIEMSFYADTANGQGGETPTDFPGALQADSGTITATLLTDSFNFDSAGAFNDADLYSMTLGTSGTLTPGGSLVGRSQAQVAVNAVPEPASLLMLGGSLIAMGAFWRRRRAPGRTASV